MVSLSPLRTLVLLSFDYRTARVYSQVLSLSMQLGRTAPISNCYCR